MVEQADVAIAALPLRLNYQCLYSPSYGDSIIYLQPSNNDYIVHPINAGALGKGKYLSWPAGLMIDSATGAINISQSETGMRFIIGFVKAGSTDTCLSNLILAGITYADSIYVLSDHDTLASPYYNADASTPAVCNASGSGDYPDNNGHGDDQCVFDGKDKKGNQGQANGKKVKVRTISGVIDLKATVAAGAFGTNPIDGTSITVPIAYTLNDESKKAIQQINVQLIYYNKRSSIPAVLINTINANAAAFFQNRVVNNPRPPIIIVSASR